MNSQKEELLKELIRSRVIVTDSERSIVTPNGDQAAWLFDFRRIFFTPEGLSLAADIFWERFESQYPFQVAGLEASALPLVTAIVMRGLERGKKVNGFFIRKSRNKSGLLNMVEGLPAGEKVILVDDLINKGSSFLRQIKILQEAGMPIHALFAFVRYRKPSYYQFAYDAGVKLETVFSLQDFDRPLLEDENTALLSDIFAPRWRWHADKPNYFYVVPKSAPTLDETNVYVGSDSGYMWALSQTDGSVVWKYKIKGFGNKGKTILSSPLVYKGVVYFGAYDGNVYALDIKTGEEKWVYMDADWVGSSPCVSTDHGLLYIGVEFGLFRKHGGVVALNASTGKKVWEAHFPGLTHASPIYSRKYKMVVVGSNDFIVTAVVAKTGAVLWKTPTGAEVRGGGAFDEKRGYVAFGSFDGKVYILSVQNGEVVFSYQTGGPVYSTPYIEGDFLYVGSTDKRVYCFNLEKLDLQWSFETSARVFASPLVVEGKVYIGSNDGRFYELDSKTGVSSGFFQCTERVTNKAAYNAKTKHFFLPTFANEIFCLTRRFS